MLDLDSLWVQLKIILEESSNDVRVKPSSWERLRREFFRLLPTESLTASTLSGHLAVSFLPDLGFPAFSLWLFTDPVT